MVVTMKKKFALMLSVSMAVGTVLAGCGSAAKDAAQTAAGAEEQADTDSAQEAANAAESTDDVTAEGTEETGTRLLWIRI